MGHLRTLLGIESGGIEEAEDDHLVLLVPEVPHAMWGFRPIVT